MNSRKCGIPSHQILHILWSKRQTTHPVIGAWYRSQDGCCMVPNYRVYMVWHHAGYLWWQNASEFQGTWRQTLWSWGRWRVLRLFTQHWPLSNKQSGKKISVGIISLVCLNLPPCYKPEHMCLVGIIPGPHEPPLTTLNHCLTPLVDDFLDFWHPGVWFSRTNGYKHGRLVHCAIVCIVCDPPAAHKTSGFGPSSHSHFVPSVIAPIRVMVMVILITICGTDTRRRNVLHLLRFSMMLRPKQSKMQNLLLVVSNGQSCFVFHILIQLALSSLMQCTIYSLVSLINIFKIY